MAQKDTTNYYTPLLVQGRFIGPKKQLTVPVHTSFFTNPISELLFDLLLTHIGGEWTKSPLDQDTINLSITFCPQRLDTLQRSTPTDAQIAAIFNRVRAISPYFTNSIMLTYKDDFIVEYYSSLVGQDKLSSLNDTSLLLKGNLDPLYLNTKRIFSPSVDPHKISLMDKIPELAKKPIFYPINHETLRYHEDYLMRKVPQIPLPDNNEKNNQFYPTIIIPSLSLGFFSYHDGPISLNQNNTALPYQLTDDIISLESNEISIVYVSEVVIPGVTTQPLGFKNETLPYIPNLCNSTQTFIESLYSHCDISKLISLAPTQPRYWMWSLPGLSSSVSDNSVPHVPKHLMASSNEILQGLPSLFGSAFGVPHQQFEFPPDSIQPVSKINPRLSQVCHPMKLQFEERHDPFQNGQRWVEYSPPSDVMKELHSMPGIQTSFTIHDKGSYIMARVFSSNPKTIEQISDPPEIPTFSINDTSTIDHADPIELLRDIMTLIVKKPDNCSFIDFEKKLKFLSRNIFPMVLHIELRPNKNDACVDLIHADMAMAVIELLARSFNINLGTTSTKTKIISTDFSINLPFDPKFHQINVPKDHTEINTDHLLTFDPDEIEAEQKKLYNEQKISPIQFEKMYKQSGKCRKVYQTAISHFFTPLKTKIQEDIWASSILVNVTPIFISFKGTRFEISYTDRYKRAAPYLSTALFCDAFSSQEWTANSQTNPNMLNLELLSQDRFTQKQKGHRDDGSPTISVPNIATVLDIYRTTPGACDILKVEGRHPENFEKDLVRSLLFDLGSLLPQLIATECCTLLSDVSAPIILGDLCAVVYVRHSVQHLKNLQIARSSSVQDLIHAALKKSMYGEFDLYVGKMIPGLSSPNSSNFHQYQDRFEFLDGFSTDLIQAQFSNTDDPYGFTTCVSTRLFESTTEIRYVPQQEIGANNLVNKGREMMFYFSRPFPNNTNNNRQYQASNIIMFQYHLGNNYYYNPYNSLNTQYYQVMKSEHPFLEWCHQSILLKNDFQSQKNYQEGPFIASSLRYYSSTPFSPPWDILNLFHIIDCTGSSDTSKLWSIDPSQYLTVATLQSQSNNNDNSYVHITWTERRPTIPRQAAERLVKNLQTHASEWMGQKGETLLVAYCPRYHLSRMTYEARKHPEYKLSFFPIKQNTFLVFDPKYKNTITTLLNLQSNAVNPELDIDKLHQDALDLSYQSLAQTGFVPSLPNDLRHHGPGNIDQVATVLAKYSDPVLSKRLITPRKIGNQNDDSKYFYYCACESPIPVSVPVYVQQSADDTYIYTGSLPPCTPDQVKNHGRNSHLSSLYHTPYTLSQHTFICLSCFAESFTGQTGNFAQLSSDAVELTLTEPTHQTIANFAPLFTSFTPAYSEQNKDIGLHFPIGGIILSLFRQARDHYLDQYRHQANEGQNNIRLPLDKHFTEALVGMQMYLSLQVWKTIDDKGLFPRCCADHVHSLALPWQNPKHDPQIKPMDCRVPVTNPPGPDQPQDAAQITQCSSWLCPQCERPARGKKCLCELDATNLHELLDAMNLRSPCCKQPYEFTDCCAVRCQCVAGKQFCAFCHFSLIGDAHEHVRQCPHNPKPNDYYCLHPIRLGIANKVIIKPLLLAVFNKTPKEQRPELYKQAESARQNPLLIDYGLSEQEALDA